MQRKQKTARTRMAAYQDGHPGNSDPLDEQEGNVQLINFLQQQPEWKDTAVIVTYDDSDGWYDHATQHQPVPPMIRAPIRSTDRAFAAPALRASLSRSASAASR
jgi:hypothetical protein